MRYPRGLASLLSTLSFVLVLGSCADAPGPIEPSHDLQQALLTDLEEDGDGLLEGEGDGDGLLDPLPVLRRSEALDETEVVSATVGADGAVLELEDAGLRVYIPKGALSERTLITVEAPEGDLVGYHFSPHGLQFAKPVVLVQELEDTEADGFPEVLTQLVGAYFEGELLPEVDPLELLNVKVFEEDDEEVAALLIHHFSGYVIATN